MSQTQIQNKTQVKKFEVYEWEWDMVNGEYVHKDYYPTIIKARDISETLEKVSEWLDEEIKESNWDCEEISGEIINENEGYVYTICYKNEDDFYLEHQVGYNVKVATP